MSKLQISYLFDQVTIKSLNQLDDLSQEGFGSGGEIDSFLPMVNEPVEYLVFDILPNQRIDGNYIFHAERVHRAYIIRSF